MLCSSVTDPMTVSGTTIVGKKLHLPSRELQTLEENQEMESDPEIKGEHEIKAQVVNWSSGFDILDFLKSLN